MKRLDLIGQRFGKLEVIAMAGIKNGATTWLCKCSCGNETVVSVGDLRSGHTKSCGCLWKEAISKSITTHEKSKTKLYQIWQNMLNRCRNKNTDRYYRYGGRGITVCDEWKTFEEFHKWSMSNGYSKGLSIERNDINGNYEPSNCRWIPLEKQQDNTKRSRFETFNGKTQTTAQWAREFNVDYKNLMNRLYLGWDIGKALTTPTYKHK